MVLVNDFRSGVSPVNISDLILIPWMFRPGTFRPVGCFVPGHFIRHILNLNPNATSNTFLNNSEPTKYRLIPFKPLLDKCVRHQIVECERSA